MDWTAILKNAGTPEPLGREEAIARTIKVIEQRYELSGGPKRAKGTNSRPVQSVSRVTLQAKERKARERG